jgi:integrase
VVIESTSDNHHLWESREDFLTGLVELLLNGAISAGAVDPTNDEPDRSAQDLPEPQVHQLLRQAKDTSLRDYALAYLLFGAGLEPEEIASLRRSHQISDKTQHILQVGERQVPVNQWILGKRYGSYLSNPLTKWLQSRKDESPWLFVNNQGISRWDRLNVRPRRMGYASLTHAGQVFDALRRGLTHPTWIPPTYLPWPLVRYQRDQNSRYRQVFGYEFQSTRQAETS